MHLSNHGFRWSSRIAEWLKALKLNHLKGNLLLRQRMSRQGSFGSLLPFKLWILKDEKLFYAAVHVVYDVLIFSCQAYLWYKSNFSVLLDHILEKLNIPVPASVCWIIFFETLNECTFFIAFFVFGTIKYYFWD